MQPEITETNENIIERISKKEHLGLVTTDQHDNQVEALLNKLNYWKLLRVQVLSSVLFTTARILTAR